jgi:hypothetical protein
MERVRRLCGFVNPASVVLASAFRAVGRLAPDRGWRRPVLYTQLPVNLRPPGASQPIFANAQTYIRLRASQADLADRDELARILHRQFRDQIRRGVERGMLLPARILSRSPRPWTAIGLNIANRNLSFVFSYHGTIGAGLETFCGTAVENVLTGLPVAWARPGLGFAAHQFGGRLNLMVTAADTVPEARSAAFLEAVVKDLLA